MTRRKFDVEAKSLGELLSTGSPQFVVPNFQRPYAWTNEQIDQLWSDLLLAIDERDDDYFIGATVLTRSNGKLSIIDGQQRIASLTVMLATVRDHFDSLGDTETAAELHRLIIRKTLRKETERIVVLRDDEGEHLRQHIQPRINERTGEQRPRRPGRRGRPKKIYIKQAYGISNEVIEEQLAKCTTDTRKLSRLTEIAEFVRDRVVFITTIVDSDTDAYVVFETLNDRGLDLSIADLVKNHLYSLGRRRLDEMIAYWEQTTSYLEGISFPRFLRQFWLSKYTRVTERKLFKHIKEHLRGGRLDDHLRFASELSTEASLYRSLWEPAITDRSAADLIDMKEMGIQQQFPLLLAGKSLDLSSEDFSRLVRICGALTVRYLIVGDRNPNRLEANYSRWAIELRTRKEDAVPLIAQEARDLCPGDDEFVEGFKTLAALKTATARYILRKVNEQMGGREIPRGPADVHVEHILPLNPSQDWARHIPEERREARALAQRLGNLTLLAEPLNKEASNRAFAAKASRYYNQSQLEITRRLCAETAWDSQTIEKRQNEMAALAPRIWSFD